MRRTGVIVLGLAMLSVVPAAAQDAEERETVRDLLGLLADARTGAEWTAALRPYPVMKLDSLLRRHGLDLRGQDPRRPPGGTSATPRRDRFVLTMRRHPPTLVDVVRLEEAVRRMERDIERWILRAASGSGSPGAPSAGGPQAPPRPRPPHLRERTERRRSLPAGPAARPASSSPPAPRPPGSRSSP